jgi:c-di-GMP-related signal transduction protein
VPLIDVVVARQAIFDRAQAVIGYELLFRSMPAIDDYAPLLDGDFMTGTVIFSSMNIGIERLVGDKLIFCNAGRGLFTGEVPLLLPPDRTVVEILETVAPDAEILKGCRRLTAAGFRLALDDFVWFDGAEKFLKLASIVKLDLVKSSPEEIDELIVLCRRYGVKLLAEKIESDEAHDRCYAKGFDYFQGYALGRPRNVPGHTMPTGNLGRIQSAMAMLSSDADLEELEDIIRTEPGLMYQLLHLASTGTKDGLRRDVRTLRDALVIVGTRRAKNWLSLLLLRESGSISEHDLEIALIRARMTEILADSRDRHLASFGFTAGMLSAFEQLLGQSGREISQRFPLDPELAEAAFGDSSQMARLVRDVVDYQSGHRSTRRRSGAVDVEMDVASIQATAWAVRISGTLRAA